MCVQCSGIKSVFITKTETKQLFHWDNTIMIAVLHGQVWVCMYHPKKLWNILTSWSAICGCGLCVKNIVLFLFSRMNRVSTKEKPESTVSLLSSALSLVPTAITTYSLTSNITELLHCSPSTPLNRKWHL